MIRRTAFEPQEILGNIADVAIEEYAVESARARAAKMKNAPHDLVNVCAHAAASRIAHSARQVFAALDLNDELPAPERVDTVAARRRIAATVISAGRYPL